MPPGPLLGAPYRIAARDSRGKQIRVGRYRTCVNVVNRKQAVSFGSFDINIVECGVVPARANADHAPSVRMVL
jgi:hypothetical protein